MTIRKIFVSLQRKRKTEKITFKNLQTMATKWYRADFSPKDGNIAVDLPDANVAIQISGTFGSRQEEAQRLGRILRPKPGPNSAYFYTIVTQNSMEQDFALNRQMFLTEQGYEYRIERFNQ